MKNFIKARYLTGRFKICNKYLNVLYYILDNIYETELNIVNDIIKDLNILISKTEPTRDNTGRPSDTMSQQNVKRNIIKLIKITFMKIKKFQMNYIRNLISNKIVKEYQLEPLKYRYKKQPERLFYMLIEEIKDDLLFDFKYVKISSDQPANKTEEYDYNKFVLNNKLTDYVNKKDIDVKNQLRDITNNKSLSIPEKIKNYEYIDKLIYKDSKYLNDDIKYFKFEPSPELSKKFNEIKILKESIRQSEINLMNTPNAINKQQIQNAIDQKYNNLYVSYKVLSDVLPKDFVICSTKAYKHKYIIMTKERQLSYDELNEYLTDFYSYILPLIDFKEYNMFNINYKNKNMIMNCITELKTFYENNDYYIVRSPFINYVTKEFKNKYITEYLEVTIAKINEIDIKNDQELLVEFKNINSTIKEYVDEKRLKEEEQKPEEQKPVVVEKKEEQKPEEQKPEEQKPVENPVKEGQSEEGQSQAAPAKKEEMNEEEDDAPGEMDANEDVVVEEETIKSGGIYTYDYLNRILKDDDDKKKSKSFNEIKTLTKNYLDIKQPLKICLQYFKDQTIIKDGKEYVFNTNVYAKDNLIINNATILKVTESYDNKFNDKEYNYKTENKDGKYEGIFTYNKKPWNSMLFTDDTHKLVIDNKNNQNYNILLTAISTNYRSIYNFVSVLVNESKEILYTYDEKHVEFKPVYIKVKIN